MSPKEFYRLTKKIGRLNENDLISFFGYYLQAYKNQKSFLAREIDACFTECDILSPRGTAVYLTKLSKRGPNAKFLKADRGYKLVHDNHNAVKASLGENTSTLETSNILAELSKQMKSGFEKDFLNETILCFNAGATRATITMIWLLTVNHLYQYIYKEKLSDFNSALIKQGDKKLQKVVNMDDFSDIPDGKLIDICRSASIISNDIRRLLVEKLGTRNSAAHPSAMKFSPRTAEEYVENLVNNVILKYPF